MTFSQRYILIVECSIIFTKTIFDQGEYRIGIRMEEGKRTFNRPVDLNSVVPATTVYFEGDAISQGTVIFSNANKTITFTATDETVDFATISGSWFFDFLLIGTDDGDGAVTDANGMVLDGDEDGEAGGNFELKLYIIG